MHIKNLLNDLQAAKITDLQAVQKPGLQIPDIVIIAIYLIGIFGLGLFFWYFQWKKKQGGTDNFFTGGGRNPILIVGLSMFATIISSLGLLNVAGLSFTTRWMWAGINIALIGVTPFIALFVIPFYRRLKESTAYAYLENRFHYSLRAISAIAFIFYQIFRVGIVLFVPITALSAVVDINEYLWIAIVGIVVIVTTTFGGFKAVIWSDAIQGLILILGITTVVIAGLVKTDWGSNTLQFHEILTKDSWKVNALQGGIAMIFLYNSVNSLHAFMGSQEVTQRYKGTNTIGKIRKTLYITGALNIVMTLLFFGAGSVLYSYYTSKGWQPSEGFNGIQEGLKNNGFLVYTVATLLPVGFLGFFMAAVFAASQSTISSGLSAIANCIVVDLVQKAFPKASNKALLILSKVIVAIFGLFSIAFGSLLVFTKQDKLFDYFAGIVGLFNAPIIAIFLLGIFTKRANWIGCLVGVLTSFAVMVPVWFLDNSFWPGGADGALQKIIVFNGVYQTIVSFLIATLVSVVVSEIVNYFSPKHLVQNQQKLSNRTWWTRSKNFKALTQIETKISVVEKWAKKGLIHKDLLTQLNAKMQNLEQALDKE